jgi:NAD(P)-dependent dehydrogenase (short-subunit alcohol dehydrogenase family)
MIMTTQEHKIAFITGANSGVGFQLTQRLLSEGWSVIALVRSEFADNESLIRDARKSGRLSVYKADFSDFVSLRKALHEIKTAENKIDVLFNNAGVSLGEPGYSKQGRELHFEVNAVVPYIIAMELKELLAKGELKTVINTSSNALLMVKRFDPESLEKPVVFKKLLGPYALSKYALSLWSQEMAASAILEGIEIRSVCPGPNKTVMTKGSGMPKLLIPLVPLFFSHPSVGASRLYEAAFGSHKGTTGIFINKGKATPLKFAHYGRQVLEKVDFIYKREFLSL